LDDELKSLCRELAGALDSSTGPKVLRLMRKISVASVRHKERKQPASEKARVGIWKASSVARAEDQVFKRIHASAEELSLWSDTEQIGPKRSRHPRILFFGESVARGFFYDPFYCPAKVLEKMLRAVPGMENCEIIDLAKTAQRLFDFRRLFSSALILKPDAIVIMSGNNWSVSPPDVLSEMLTHMYKAQTHEGFGSLSTHMQHQYKNRLTSMLQSIGRLVRPLKIPVILTVTDFNLGDWDTYAGQQDFPAFLREGVNQQWLQESVAAEKDVESGRYDEAAGRAKHLLDMDGETSGRGFQILAKCAMASSDFKMVRHWLERTKDAKEFLGVAARCPGPNFITQKVIREHAPQLGLSIVDLPEEFDRQNPGRLPDRDFYHDYCHLTARGIRFSMAAIARQLAGQIRGSKSIEIDFESIVSDVDPSVEANALFLAAIHNTHWGQPPTGLISYQCQRALALDEKMANYFRWYIEYKSKYADNFLSTPFQNLVAQNAALKKYLAGHFNPERKLDLDLVDMMRLALAEIEVPTTISIDENRIRNFAVSPSGTDLIEFRQWCRPFGDKGTAKIGYLKSFESISIFPFFSDASCDLFFEITTRVTSGDGTEKIHVEINGKSTFELQSSRKWRTFKTSVPKYLLKPGRNLLALNWPAPKFDIPGQRLKIISDLEAGEAPTIFPIFGEVHKLIAMNCPP